jgi:phosphatidate phosphatase APP1
VKFGQDRSPLRLTDLPYSRWRGFLIRFFKTFEVVVFKLLQVLDLYKPQKSIVGIPTLATRNLTSLQAVIYNGTQEGVLGFRPRRLLHKILRGVPDLELFERIRFQLALSENTMRSVEASTETRGFIHLQVPWQLPWKTPKMAWLRMQPVGVETVVGRIKLGEYEVASSPVFFLNEEVKRVIISDIDDTIKDSKIRETTGMRQVLSGIFKGNYYSYDDIPGMAELYQYLVSKGSLIVYVTATPYQLAPFLLKFLRERNFPEGPVFMRWLGYGRFGHKWRTIHRILSQVERQKLIFIGDSGEQDLQIYRRICETPIFANRIEKVLIRHVPGTPRHKTLHERELYYGEISELTAIMKSIC